MQWQPIDTAPIDKTWCLVYEEESGEIYIAIFGNHPLDVEDNMGNVWTDGHMSLRPTHWAPLPEPPNAKVSRAHDKA